MSEEEKITIAIVDDETLIVQLLEDYFRKVDSVQVVMKAYDGKEFIEQLKQTDKYPDIVLLDLRMKEMDGIETTTYLREHFPEIKIIVMSSHYMSSFMGYMLKTGVNAFIPKEISPDFLTNVIHSVKQHGYYFSEEHVEVMRTQIAPKVPKPKLTQQEILSEREMEILKLICQQFTSQEIADKLFIARRTVEGHKGNLLLKTAVKNTAGLVIYAIQNQLIDPDELVIN
ncbi:MAG: response regulator transcription factor [Flavobacteriia bacterium]|nr:response regulator transcription factor [Flavobacteriia bacterium]